MARVRIYLPTYRRPQFLPLALASLRAQTVTDWICEVHNDDPEDLQPGHLLAGLADARFILKQHPRKLGGPATFNLFFNPTSEPFYSLHEDDNAWAPDFLAVMLATAEQFPDVTIFWSNMRIRKENTDGTLEETGTSVWPEATANAAPQLIAWGHDRQLLGAVHSNGATLIRSRPGQHFVTPEVPFNMMEMFRERMFPHPLVFVPQALAYFTVTRQSARAVNPHEWALLQTLLAATFIKHAAFTQEHIQKIWSQARASSPPQTNAFLLAGLVDDACRPVLQGARLRDWLRFIRSTLRRPTLLLFIHRSRYKHADWWTWLDRITAERFRPPSP